MKLKLKIAIIMILCIAVIIFSIGMGSVYISPKEIISIIVSRVFGINSNVKKLTESIIWNMRLPRVLLAFVVGSILSVSGVVMQSVLKNTLASSYTLGVSSGAAFGVALTIFLGIPVSFFGFFTLPFIGLVFGILTVVLSVTFASKIDKGMGNHTIVLVGMIFSLFINAMLTLISAISRDTLQKMIYWQMGSFSLKDWSFVIVIIPISCIGIIILMTYAKELDNLTFGEDAAFVVGIDVKKTKWILLFISAALTGCSVALVGVIGFVDLIIPHITRKMFGASHRIVIPMAAALGGIFMVISDVVARTIVTPSDLPIGAVTAIIGAPFFVYTYTRRGSKSSLNNNMQ